MADNKDSGGGGGGRYVWAPHEASAWVPARLIFTPGKQTPTAYEIFDTNEQINITNNAVLHDAHYNSIVKISKNHFNIFSDFS
jgi:hypothetical protein